MPGRDGTGPGGQGPMTGWSQGLCQTVSNSVFGGRGGGLGIGNGRSLGRGLGLVITVVGLGLRLGRRLYENNMTAQQNQPADQLDYRPIEVLEVDKVREIEHLKAQVEALKAEVENLKKS